MSAYDNDPRVTRVSETKVLVQAPEAYGDDWREFVVRRQWDGTWWPEGLDGIPFRRTAFGKPCYYSVDEVLATEIGEPQ